MIVTGNSGLKVVLRRGDCDPALCAAREREQRRAELADSRWPRPLRTAALVHREPGDLHPMAQLRHRDHVQLWPGVRVPGPRAAERGVVALALSVVLPPVDVHRARPLEAGHPA
jgi:hypothetical protein